MKPIYKTPVSFFLPLFNLFPQRIITTLILCSLIFCTSLAMASPRFGTLEAPQITVTPLSNTVSITNRTLQATITAGTGVTAANLYYRVNGGAWYIAPSSNVGSNYSFTINGQPAGTLVEYFVTARSGVDSSTAPASVNQQSVYGSFYEYSILCAASQNRQLAFQGFENGPLANNWNYTASCVTGCTSFNQFSKVSNTNLGTDIPANSRIRTGSYSYQHQSNGAITASLVFDGITIPAGATNIRITVRVASISAVGGNGADVTDHIKAWAAVNNNNFPAVADITLTGRNKIRYGYSATGIVYTTAGTPVTYTPANGGGGNQPVAGQSTLQINIPNGSTTAALKLEIRNEDNSNNKIWAIDDIEITADVPAATGRYFKTINNGMWSSPFTWAVSNTLNGNYQPSCSAPNFSNSDFISISEGDTIIIKEDLTGSSAVDQLLVNDKACIILQDNQVDFLNSVSGKPDLQLAGTIWDKSMQEGINFTNGSTWQMMNTGVYIKCGSSDVSGWRDHYATGIENIPATANWIYCYDGTGNVNILTEDMYYPNLTFENKSGSVLHQFNPMRGAAGTAVIKGDLKIGDRSMGSNPVKLLYNNISSDLMMIEGKLFVDSGSIFTNSSFDGNTSSDHGNGSGVDLKGGLQVGGDFNFSADSAMVGQIKFSGTVIQDISGNGKIKMEDATIDNRAGGRIEINNDISIYGTLSFSSSQSKLVLGTGNIHLKSTAERTSNVGIIPNGVLIQYADTGRFIVERFIQTPRKWQLLSTPVHSTGSIRQNWQENGIPGDSLPGFGANITGPTAPVGGLDQYTYAYSLKTYVPGDSSNVYGSFDFIENTNSTALENPYGYYFYVYGDRKIHPYSLTGSTTVLRSKGKLFVGNDVVNDLPVEGTGNQDHYMSVGNPFASAIDFTKLKLHSSIDDEFYLWDPKMEGDYTAGAYVAFSGSTNPPYMPIPWLGTPAQPSNTPSPSFPEPNTRIESGQAFFVYKSGSGNARIKFEENDKVDSSRDVNRNPDTNRPPRPIPGRAQFNMSLHAVNNGQSRLLDGNAVVWSSEFRQAQRNGDMRKMWNASDNFAISGDDGKELVVDTRSNFAETDTVKLLMFGQFYQQYSFKFSQTNLPSNVKAWLVDKYLASKTSINLADTGTYQFSVDGNPASTAVDRFYLLFANAERTITPQQEIAVIDEISANAFPNPAPSSGFTVRVNTIEANKKYNLQLINSDGKVVYTTQFISSARSSLVPVRPNSGLQAGYYKVFISDGKNTVTINQLVLD